MAVKASHKDELENKKYRNWVKASLSLKYLKDGISDFADECAKSELDRILHKLGLPGGSSCNQCSLTSLKPEHVPPSKTKHCPIGQRHCNCLQNNTISCPNNICGRIYDEIVDSHWTQSPNWKNTDITKWTTNPWEIAKCFINAPGYAATMSASDTDVAGLLHLFLNSTGFQGHMQCAILFNKIKTWRNSLFHSPTMELEDQQLTDGINDIVMILKAGKKLKDKKCSKHAIHKLINLQQENFVITTETEAEVIRTALDSINQRIIELTSTQEELKPIHEEAKKDIDLKQEEAKKDIALKQEEAKKDIALKQEEAKKDIASKQEEAVQTLQNAADAYNSHLRREMSEIRDTVKTHELKIQSLNMKVNEIQQDVEQLKNVKYNKTEHLEKIEKIIALKRKLKERYRTHYINTSQSPLKTTENDIEISQVYVPPNMTKVTKITSENGKKKEHTVQILDYSRIFLTDDKPNKRIFLLGDVGTGKSAFCKMMMRNWCLSSEVQDESAAEDVRTLGQFELLFYLPLCTLTDKDSLLEMVAGYYGDICSKDYLLNILQLIPERCIVLADGIDEWKPKTIKIRRAHEIHGLPTIDKMDHVTIVMTSRPSAPGILNMDKSNYDIKVRLNGIRKQDVETLFKRLYPKSHSEDIRKFRDVPIKDLEKTPLLLKQIAWLQQQNIDIGKSKSEVYSNVVNIALRWNRKHAEKEAFGHTPSAGSKFTELSFPDQIKNNYPEFILQSSVILGLGKMAFEIMTQGYQFSFGTLELNKNGIDEYLRTKMLGTGLLTEEVRFDISKENTQFYFTRTSFLEYFAALYIASHGGKDHKEACHRRSIFDIIMEMCHSIQDVVRLENMFVIVCGLIPSLINNVCLLMYESLKQSHIYEQKEILLPHLYSCKYNRLSTLFELETLSDQCRDLAYRCIRECKLSDPQCTLKIPYFAVFYEDRWSRKAEKTKEVMQHVDPLSVSCCCISSNNYPVSDLTVFQNLQILKIDFVDPADNDLSPLAEFITQTLTLRYISLINKGSFGRRYCTPLSIVYKIYLSKHKQLHSLVLHNFRNIHVNDINTVNLNHCITRGTTCSIFSPHAEKLIDLEITDIVLEHDKLSDLIKLINGSVLLKTIKISDVGCFKHQHGCSHVVDLLHHNQLHTLDVSMFRGVCLLLKDVNTANLNYCVLKYTKVSFTALELTKLHHLKITECTIRCDELSMLIAQSVLLRELDITKFKCSVHKGCNNAVNLSRHSRLEVVEGSDVHFSKISTLNLKRCTLYNSITSFTQTDSSNNCQLIRLMSLSLKHDDLSDLAKFINRTVSVRKLTLSEIKCLDHKHCSHKIDLSHFTQLEDLTVDRPFTCDKINTSNLTYCSTNSTKMLHCLRDSANLAILILRSFKKSEISISYSKDVHGCVLTLPKLHHLSLGSMNIEDGVLVMKPEINCLKTIHLSDVNMSESSWFQFLESILAMNQSVECNVSIHEPLFEQYVNNYLSENTEKFQVLSHRGYRFILKSLK